MTDMMDVFENLIGSNGLSSVDRVDLPARSERASDIPSAYCTGLPKRWFTNDDKLRGRLWLHQSKAMEAAAKEHNVVISTGTASGKSLVFQSVAFRSLDKDDGATAIIFYPLKALASDQQVSWRRAAEFAGLGSSAIAKIDGDVLRNERAELLKNARIVLMTPDICHSWLLNEISNPVHRDFLARVSLVVIDEAHVLEGVFGSNFAYLFRRLCAARSLSRPGRQLAPLQVVATSATILKPEEHLGALTGLPFVTIGEDDDGSPSHDRSIIHVYSEKGSEIEITAPFLRQLVEESDDGSFITFVDSRQRTERLAVAVNYGNLVKPYRSGYEADDRSDIENALHNGHLRGVVSTSALELGINVPHFAVGINIGVPTSRKSFRQRLGRVGRQRRGIFCFFADLYEFRQFGTSLNDYYQASVEPSYLYLHNRFMQYAHARCLSEELEMLGVTGRKSIPSVVSWPDGFKDVFDFAYSGAPAARPREFDSIAQIGGDQPHYNYPLRNVPEEAFQIVSGQRDSAGNYSRVSRVNLQQAIREAFPGAIYLHMAKGWRVHEWRTTAFERTIRVSPSRSPIIPKPITRKSVNLSLDRQGLVDGRFRKGKGGLLAECHLQVTERVEGYNERGERKLYKDLRQENPSMTPKTRDFRTTGVVMQIDESWFQEKNIKQQISDVLRDLMLREYSISLQDVDSVATNISLIREGMREPVSNMIVIFDATHGSLRLTEPAYLQFERLLDQLERSTTMTPSKDRLLSGNVVSNLRNWFDQLGNEDKSGLDVGSFSVPSGWIQIFDVGSIVTQRDSKGVHRDIEIIDRSFFDLGDGPKLFYQYRTGTTADDTTQMVLAERVEAVGDDWNLIYWNPETGETRDSFDDSND